MAASSRDGLGGMPPPPRHPSSLPPLPSLLNGTSQRLALPPTMPTDMSPSLSPMFSPSFMFPRARLGFLDFNSIPRPLPFNETRANKVFHINHTEGIHYLRAKCQDILIRRMEPSLYCIVSRHAPRTRHCVRDRGIHLLDVSEPHFRLPLSFFLVAARPKVGSVAIGRKAFPETEKRGV